MNADRGLDAVEIYGNDMEESNYILTDPLLPCLVNNSDLVCQPYQPCYNVSENQSDNFCRVQNDVCDKD